MGVSISATNSKYSFDMGGGGFFDLRKNIAYVLNEELGKVYETRSYQGRGFRRQVLQVRYACT